MRDALNRTGHPIVLSIEPFSINPDPAQSYKVANLWRTGCDISGNWNDIVSRADIADKVSAQSPLLIFLLPHLVLFSTGCF